MNAAARKTLEDVRWLLDEKTWIKNTELTRENGMERMCLLGALKRADGPGEADAKAILLSVIHEKYAFSSIPNFNDAAYRKYADIVEVLDAAIKKAGT